MKARDLMTSSPEAVTPEQPVADAASIMAELDVGYVPVVRDPDSLRLVGVVTDRDLTVRHVAAGHGPGCLVRRDMTAREGPGGLVTVRMEDSVEHVLAQMAKHQLRRLPVVEDDDQQLVGVIAQADVVRLHGPEHPAEIARLLRTISRPSGRRATIRAATPARRRSESRNRP